MVKEKLTLNKRFLIIDSPIPFTLIANEGTDNVYRPAGAWQLNIWELLPERFFKQYPVFNLEIVYDETQLKEGEKVVIRESDINLGTGLSGVNGQLVQVENFPLSIECSNIPEEIEVKNKLGTVQEITFNELLQYVPNQYCTSEFLKNLFVYRSKDGVSQYIFNNKILIQTSASTTNFLEIVYCKLLDNQGFEVGYSAINNSTQKPVLVVSSINADSKMRIFIMK